MNILKWLRSLFTGRGKALLLYRRRMARAKKLDRQGAIDDYTTAVDMPNAPPDVKAMALYNRALVYAADEDIPKAIKDLNMVLESAKAPTDVKAETRRKLERMERQSSKANV